MKKRLVIIGAGPAGLSAAIGAVQNGISPEDVLIIERESELGGVLNQCVHNGFGEHSIGQVITGTEYAEYFVNEVKALNIPYITESTVLSISKDKEITFVSTSLGYTKLTADAIILAMGCRERSHGSLRIAGTRPAGVFSAGTVQRFINTEGYLPGKRIVMFGSGDIGLITARRLVLEGAEVIGVYERKHYPIGLDKNLKECLEEFNISFHTGKTISKILGKERVEGVIISDMDENKKIIKGTEQLVKCDTLVLSLGLIPDNVISMDAGIELDRQSGGPVINQNYQTCIEGIFSCGNALHIHDLVDYITKEASKAGRCSASYLLGKTPPVKKELWISHKGEIKYTVPHKIEFPTIDTDSQIVLSYRVSRKMKNVRVTLEADDVELYSEEKSDIYPSRRSKIRITADMLRKIEKAQRVVLKAEELL